MLDKKNVVRRSSYLLAGLMLLLGIGLTANGAFAHIVSSSAAHSAAPSRPHAAFTPGDLVIYRVGDGTAALVNTGVPVFLDEYTPLGILVQSISVPTTTVGLNRRLIASGTATSEGLLTRSTDGKSTSAT